MKKIINSPETVVEDMIQGIIIASNHKLTRIKDTQVVVRTANEQPIVGLVSGGGSGHEPSHAGFVGLGMLTAAVCGEVFTSPTPDQILEAIKAADKRHGVLLIIKNYTGDRMNFEMAQELAQMEGIECGYVVVNDDIAVEDSLYTAGRRGVAGTLFVHKIAGALADKRYSLSDIKTICEEVIANTRTIGVALSPATVPAVGKPGFSLEENEIELGIGIHGEPGYEKVPLLSAKELAKELVTQLESEQLISGGDNLAVLVNGMGATPLMEQYIFTKEVSDLFNSMDIKTPFVKVGNYMTALDMSGLSITILKLTDPLWLNLLEYPVETLAWA